MCKKIEEMKDINIVEKKRPMYTATVEEALSTTGFGKYSFGLLLVCSWTLQAMGMDLFGTSFVMAAAVCDLGLSMQQQALLTAMPLCDAKRKFVTTTVIVTNFLGLVSARKCVDLLIKGVVLGAQLWGYVSDTRGRRLTLVLSMSVGFVFAALSSMAPDWKTMAFLKLVSSTFTSASNSAAYTLLGESIAARARGRSLLLGTSALMCSQAMVAAIAYPILPLEFSHPIQFLGITYRPWRLLALVMALPCAVTAGLLQLFHESPKFLASRGRMEEALRVLRSIYICNTGCDADSFPIKKLIEDDNQSISHASFFRSLLQQTVPLFQRPLLATTLKLFYLVLIIYMTGSGFILWLPYIMNSLFSALEDGGGDGLNLCAVIRMSAQDNFVGNDTALEICDDTIQPTTLFSAMTYGALASGSNLVLSLTCGSRKRLAMMAILTMSASSAVLLNVVAVPLAGGFFFFVFLLCALSMGLLSVYFVELYPTHLRGMASCLSVMLGRSSAFFGVNLIGALITTNCEATFYVWSLLIFSGIICAWFLPRDEDPSSSKEQK